MKQTRRRARVTVAPCRSTRAGIAFLFPSARKISVRGPGSPSTGRWPSTSWTRGTRMMVPDVVSSLSQTTCQGGRRQRGCRCTRLRRHRRISMLPVGMHHKTARCLGLEAWQAVRRLARRPDSGQPPRLGHTSRLGLGRSPTSPQVPHLRTSTAQPQGEQPAMHGGSCAKQAPVAGGALGHAVRAVSVCLALIGLGAGGTSRHHADVAHPRRACRATSQS